MRVIALSHLTDNIEEGILTTFGIGVKVAVKAMQKGRIQDYESFKNEIAILKQLVRPWSQH